MIGMLAVLNWSIEVFKEAGEFYLTQKISIESDDAVVKADAIAESVKQEVEETPSPTPLDEVMDKIAILESGNGKNQPTYCTSRGLTNKYGYGVYGDKITCFETDEEARATISLWFKNKVDSGLALEECLCLWNTGSATNSCDYLEKFKNIKLS